MSFIYNLYSSKEFGFTKSFHIKCEIPPHKFRLIMSEFRQNGEENTEDFVKYMSENFPDSFQLFEYDDVLQYDADQENSAILANLLTNGKDDFHETL
ncbi:hypothetical protein COJ85_03745 [Bacillus sp. AFS076308]|uniref:hypothetical protein n=1 Tax=unclassified Bacillus (in: firmicutes) TaxID=185979 RepID=UPI000BF9439C|nr:MULTISPECIES: hypothetical protein [unclassified Bacillus (in: firmicutes)]PFO08366.1 hypothetical protein COJ85_03745 [Bacillus sp. AFS076308]PGV50625.1 hypothetical protein COD92_16945 [Bacillus sp. AFS037270]